MNDDVRKVVQDLAAPDLKSIQVLIKANDDASKLRDNALEAKIDDLSARMDLKFEALSDKLDNKFEALSTEIDANHQAILYALNIDKRVEAIERKQAATM